MDNIKKLLLILLLLSAVTAFASADVIVKMDNINAFETFDQALGGFYGEIGGMGLSYQRWFGNIGFQTALGLWYYEEDSLSYAMETYSPAAVEEVLFTYNAGIEFMYKVYEDTFQDWFDGSLYVFAGVLHMGNLINTYNYAQTPEDDGYGGEVYPFINKTGPSYVAILAPGFGIGFELFSSTTFQFPLR